MGTIWRRESTPLPDGIVLYREDEEVIGVNHRLSVAFSFAKGQNPELEFERDSKNPVDQNAIKIVGKYTERGIRKSAHIGFVSKDVARLIAVYAEGAVLSPNLKLIWQGDERKEYLLIKYDIWQYQNKELANQQIDSPARKLYLPVDYDQAFAWWCGRPQNGGQFPYVCLTCGTMVPIRKRIVVSKRNCPKCHEPITLGTIDFLLKDSEEDRLAHIRKECGCGCLVLITTGIGTLSGMLTLICCCF